MSDALAKPWIESAVTGVLVEHAHELPSPPKVGGRAQIVKFLTFREDSEDGRQPTDRDTVLWAEITDRQWIIPVRIANEATNQIEDKEKRALTYFRRGFFTLKASVAFDFVAQQVSLPGGGFRIQRSTRKQLVLDITELNYISGGGAGAPVATNSVALQTCPALKDWESALAIGGQTLANKQRSTRITLEAARVAKASSRRTVSNSAGKAGNKLSAKRSAPVLPHQPPSIDKLAAFHEWQDSYWGRRHKYRTMDFEFPRGEFDVPPDQQAILRQIEERIKSATQSQPYDPTNSKSVPSSAPDRQNDLPTFPSSQVYTSTPLDAQRRPSSPSESDASYDAEEAGGPNLDESDEDGDRDAKSDISQEQKARGPLLDLEDNEASFAGSDAAPGVDEAPDMDNDVEHDPQLLSHPDAGGEKPMDADDAVSEKILSAPTADNMSTELEPLLEAPAPPRRPIVLVPDSDPIGSSQVQSQPNYARGSSPWDIESSAPSQLHSDRLSPEVAKSGSNKGKRRYSPMLSSPLQPSGSLFNPSQLSGQQSEPQKASTGSGNSQESAAAASLPSPPPEHPPTQPTPSQPHARFSPDITNEPTARDQQSGNEKVMESFDTIPRVESGVRTSPNRRKRRRSPSRVRDGGLTLASVGGVAIVAHDREMETTKRRRLDDPNAHLTQERAVAREDISETRFPQTANTNDDETSTNRPGPNAPNPQDVGAPPPYPRAASPPNSTVPQDVIPHDHDAWAAPSYMAAQPKAKVKEGKLVKGNALNAPRAVSISSSVSSLPGPPRRQVLDPKPRISLPLPRHSVARRAVSPELPPVTASQVADADEDADIRSPPASKLAPKPALKVEPPTPARPTKSRASILSSTPSRPRSSISYAGSGSTEESSNIVLPKVARTSTVTSTTKLQGSRVHLAGADAPSNTTVKSKPQDELRPAKPRASGVGSGKSKTVTKNAEESAGGPSTQRKLLGGFKPSVLPSLEDQFISTWAMWLESVQEAESFWESV